MLKPMNPQEYRAHADAIRQSAPTEIVQLKSGAIFVLCRPDLQGMVLTGRVPQSLLAEGLAAWKKNGIVSENELRDSGMNEDPTASLIFMREIVHECTVNPKFVEFATEPHHISAGYMLKEDFLEIFSWAITNQGVKGLYGLKSFRAGRERGTATHQPRSKKRRKSAESIVETEQMV